MRKSQAVVGWTMLVEVGCGGGGETGGKEEVRTSTSQRERGRYDERFGAGVQWRESPLTALPRSL